MTNDSFLATFDLSDQLPKMNLPNNDYRVIIIDDDIELCRNLHSYFENQQDSYNVIKTCHDYACALHALKNDKPDIVLLDIELGSKSSFQLIEELDKIDFEIIFITGHNEHALSALKFSAIDYLLKPFSKLDLDEAMRKAKLQVKNNIDINRYHVLRHNILRSQKSEQKIIIPESNSYEFVTTRDIIRCEGWSKYTKVYLLDGRTITSSYNLGHYRKLLENHNFFHCHKSHIININHIKRYQNVGFVEMKDGSLIPVSRRRKEQFVKVVIKDNFFFKPDHTVSASERDKF